MSNYITKNMLYLIFIEKQEQYKIKDDDISTIIY